VEEKDRIFLTRERAIVAIQNDFRQYAPQARLFRDISPLILGDRAVVMEDPRRGGFWFSTTGGRMRRKNAAELGEILCRELETAPPALDILVRICIRVFKAPARTGRQRSGGTEGLWLDTGMEEFSCRQCGRCCRALDYHSQLTEADCRRWRRLGRDDILSWVRIRKDGPNVSYRIWTVPGTPYLADVCPWLRKVPGREAWHCEIHDVKPEICRQYPASRKHAKMTGCTGFP
jgi:Fe-S-cluster containining protein